MLYGILYPNLGIFFTRHGFTIVFFFFFSPLSLVFWDKIRLDENRLGEIR